MLAFILLGLALGAGSSVIPGPCNLAVMNAAVRYTLGRAIATAFGAALGDATLAGLGILGLGPVLARHPAVPPVLHAVSAVALIAYGLANLRPRPPQAPSRDLTSPRGRALRGIGVGLATLAGANPAAVVTWLVVVGSLLPGASTVHGVCTVVGIGAGSFAWFALIACVTRRYTRARCHRLGSIATVVSSMLVLYGVVSLGRILVG